MADINIGGEGYSWDAELIGGPFDGLIDTVISLEGEYPPKNVTKLVSDKEPKKTRISEKMLEMWGSRHIPDDQRIAFYELRGEPKDFGGEDVDDLVYDFSRTATAKELRDESK